MILGESPCKGDAGGGLIYKNQNNGRHYVTGVVSLSPPPQGNIEGCDRNHYVLYTKVDKYINDFIIPNEVKHRT